MREAVLQGVLAAISVWEVWLVYQFAYITILEKEYLGKKEKIIMWGNVIVLGSLLTVNRSSAFYSRSMLLFCILVTSVCVWMIKRKNVLLIVGVVFTVYILIAVLDFSLAFFCLEYLRMDFEHLVFLRAASWWKNGIYVITRVLVWYVIHMLKTKKADTVREIQEYIWILWVMDLLLYMIMKRYQIIMVRMIWGKERIRGFDSGITLLAVSIIILFAGLFIFKYQILKKEKELLSIRENMMSEKYREMLKMNQLVHDMKNHFIMLQRYGREGQWEKLSAYVEEISQELLSADIQKWTGNGVLDFILSQKKAEAEEKGIKVYVSAIQLAQVPFSDNEIIALFGNLLDNAIEACERIQHADKWIEIKLKKQNLILLIEVSNSIEELPAEKNGELITAKRNRGRHGYGIKSIEKIVRKHEGTFDHQIQEDRFCIILSFFDSEGTYR